MAVRTGTSRRLAARKQAAPQPPAARAERRLPSLRTALIAAVAYVIAVIFVLPYLEMLITAVRPQRELYEPNYLPHHFAWSNLTNMWGAAFGITSAVRVSLEIAGGATLLVLLVALPAAYYTSRHRFRGRGAFLILVLATQMLQPTALIVGIYKGVPRFRAAEPQPGLVADPRQRRLQPRLRDLDPQRLHRVDP